ncbi:MAG: hypothetical protein ACQEQS_09615 [Thermodesulfobacteriota bacterium]
MIQKKILISIIIIFLTVSSSGCNGSSSSSSSSKNDNSTEKFSAVKTISSEGGKVALEYDGKKAEAIIPQGALSDSKNITISKSNSLPPYFPAGDIKSGDCIKFGPEGLIFKKNITLGIPYSSDRVLTAGATNNDIKVNYFDPEKQEWTDMTVKNIDEDENIVYFVTDHFSNYITYVEKEDYYYPPENELVENEYFTGDRYYYIDKDGNKTLKIKGCINRPGEVCAEPWHLSVFSKPDIGNKYTIDRFFTINYLAGYQAEISADGASVTFNASKIFEKVKESGDARLWQWECEFVTEHTNLLNYEAVSVYDPDFDQTDEENRIYAQIEPVDMEKVKISWETDILPEIKPGHTLSVRFEARYRPYE